MNNKTFFTIFLLYLIGVFSTATALSSQSSIYKSSVSGYEIELPHEAALGYGEEALKGFYFNPLEFVPGTVEINSLVKITYSPHQFVLVGLAKPLVWPVASAVQVNINGRVFYGQHRQEAGMCHLYDYYIYWLKENDRYYLFVFLFISDCFSKPITPHEKAFRIAEIEKFLKNFKI